MFLVDSLNEMNIAPLRSRLSNNMILPSRDRVGAMF
jgi:hypothetical protein